MPAATPIPIRRTIVERREKGETYAQIARDLAMPYMTVRKVYRDYQIRGYLEPNYERCRQTEIRKEHAVYEKAMEIKGAHPGWGAGLIWVELAEEFAETDLPSIRTLQRWFRQAGLKSPKQDRVQNQVVKRGRRVHEVWAMDAKEQIRLRDGSYVSWLTISDEASGAILTADLFPLTPLDASGSATGAGMFAKDDGAVGKTGANPRG